MDESNIFLGLDGTSYKKNNTFKKYEEKSLEGLNVKQKQMVILVNEYLRKSDNSSVTVCGSAGSGKMAPYTEPILTPGGWKVMGDIKKGSEVMCPISGNPVTVKDIFPGKNLKIYKVTFDDGTFAECCNDHLWRVSTTKQRMRGNYYTLTVDQILEMGVKCKNKDNRFAIPLTAPLNFTEKEVEIDPYLMGVLLGDGYLPEVSMVCINVFYKEVEGYMERFKEVLPKDVVMSLNKRQENTVKIAFSVAIKDILRRYKLLTVKSGEKFVPKEYLYNSVAVRKAVLSGLMDTDGSCTIAGGTRKKVTFSTTSTQLKNDVVELVKSLGGTAFVTKDGRDKYKSGVCYTINIRLPFNPFNVKHKKENFDALPYTKGFVKFMVKVEFLRRDDGQCISVDSDHSLYVTKDYVVTHNSYSLQRAIAVVNSYDVVFAAPSHFAKNVLQDFVGKHYKVLTIASLLGKRLTYTDTGEQVLTPIKGMRAPIESYSVVVIDEVSMVPDWMLTEIRQKCVDKKLILVGDPSQFPPVRQDTDSIAFDKIDIMLTEPMRFTGPIYDVTSAVRKEIDKIRKGFTGSVKVLNHATNRKSMLLDSGTGYVFTNNTKAFLSSAISQFKRKLGRNHVRILAYRNATIYKLNMYIRKNLYGENAKQFEKDELVISKSSFTKGKQTLLTNGEVLTVKESRDIVGPYGVPCVSISFNENTGFSVPVVSLTGQAKYDSMLKDYLKKAKQNSALWKQYFSFLDSFAYLNYSYATTLHNSQGSSIAYVYLMEDDLLSVKPTTVKEKLQSLYVGLSRAKFRIYIYNRFIKGNNENITKEQLLNHYEESDK